MPSKKLTYRRNQMEWALWRLFSGGNFSDSEAPKVFLTRIKRLLDLDRETELYEDSETPHARYAFCESPPEGQGIDAQYTGFDVLCLAIGLDLLDSGFKQSEILFLLRHTRSSLKRRYRRILLHPPVPYHQLISSDRPNCPTYEEDGLLWADCRVYMTLSKVEMKEVFPMGRSGKGKKSPVIFSPKFYFGREALCKKLDELDSQRRKLLVIEIAEMIVVLTDHLEKAPLIKRGRK